MRQPETLPSIDLSRRDVFRDWTRAIIRYRDLDPNGHVNNGAINGYFEEGRIHFRREELVAHGRDTVAGVAIIRFDARYLNALYFPGGVEIGTNIHTRTEISFPPIGRCIQSPLYISLALVRVDAHPWRLSPESVSTYFVATGLFR